MVIRRSLPMLVDFTVSNFGPFKDPVTLSMQASSSKYMEENVIEVEQISGGLLSSAVVFGSNASGKTYLMKALNALVSMVARPHPDGSGIIWYQPFRLDRESISSPVEMRVRIIESGILYDYSLSFDAVSIVRESLYHYPNGRRACVFDRTGSLEYRKSRKAFSKVTPAGSTYLAVASGFNDGTCNTVRRALTEGFIFLYSDLDALVAESCDFAERDPDARRLIVEGLRIADFGIEDYTFSEVQRSLESIQGYIPPKVFEELQRGGYRGREWKVSIKHGFRQSDIDEDRRVFPMEIESAGTRCMLGLLGPLVDTLNGGKVLLIDELGSHLHPLITRWIIEQFSRDYNPRHAQLVANSHDISLMDNDDDVLRRDQMWFTNKDSGNGVSDLYSMDDFTGLRREANPLKAYLFGKFEAIPEIASRGLMRRRAPASRSDNFRY